MSRYRNIIFYDFKFQFLVIFFSSYLHRLVFKIPFPDHIFPKISNFIFCLLANATPPSIANLTFYMSLVRWYFTYFNILLTQYQCSYIKELFIQFAGLYILSFKRLSSVLEKIVSNFQPLCICRNAPSQIFDRVLNTTLQSGFLYFSTFFIQILE